MEFGPFVFDRGRQLLAREGREVPLPPRVLSVLDVLSARPGQIVSKQELIETVWKDAIVSDTSLAEAISFLRQALGDDPQQPSYIQTVHRRGYRFLTPAAAEPPPAVAAPARADDAAWGPVLPWAIVALLGATTVSTVWRLAKPSTPAVAPVARFEVALPAGTALDVRAPAIAISADGSQVAFSACGAGSQRGDLGCRIFVRALDDPIARPVAGTEGGAAPFLSPDGASLGFFADGKLKKVQTAGGAPVTLAEVRQPFGAAWRDDGSIVFSGSANGGPGALSSVRASGGAPEAIGGMDASGSDLAIGWPDVLPDGRTVLATAISAPGDRPRTRIVAVSLATGQRTTVLEGASFARFVPPSVLAFVRDGQLMAAAFDAGQLKITGQPVAVGWRVGGPAPQFAVSRIGVLVAAPVADAPGPALAWLSRDGSLDALPASLQQLQGPSLSADGRRIVGLTFDAARADIWSGDLARGTLARVTFEGDHRAAVWSANDRALVFAAAVNGTFNVFGRPLDGSTASRLAASARHQLPGSTSPAGLVAYTEFDRTSGADIWTAAIDGGRASAFVRTPFDETAPAFSPDGRWVAYQSNESNRWEVYARPFPGPGAAITLSTGGGTAPVWSRDGRTLFYAGPGGIMSVDIAGCDGEPACDLKPSSPRRVAAGAWVPRATTPAGLLLVERAAATAAGDRLTVTLQWTRELQRVVPPAVVEPPK